MRRREALSAQRDDIIADVLWDVNEQARALVEHTLDNYAAAKRAGLGEEYVYARHHDGSFTNNYGGVDLAKTRVFPMLPKIREILNTSNG